jgi:DNA-binding transcriptional regulator of glucitol operon
MFDVVAQNAAIILFGLVIMWIIQFGLAYKQMKSFYKRLVVLRKNGLTAVGVSGGRFKGRAYAVLTVDENNRIVHAEQFSGWTVFAKLKPVPQLMGMPLQELLNKEATLPVPKKLRTAFGNAARDLQTARDKKIEGAISGEALQLSV